MIKIIFTNEILTDLFFSFFLFCPQEASPYYQKILRTHTIFLYTETLVHDMPVACLAVEMCAQMWGIGGVNCWDCARTPADMPPPQSLPNCELWLGLLLGSIAVVSAYKGTSEQRTRVGG